MKDRIKQVRNQLGLSQTAFAEKLQISRSALSKIESGENNPSNQTIRLMESEFGINPDWIVDGSGDIFLSMSKEEEISRFIGKINFSDDNFKKRFISMLARLDESDWEVLEKMATEMAKDK